MSTKIFKSIIFTTLFFVIIYGHNGYPYGFTNRSNNTNNNLNQFYNSTGLPNCYCNGYKGPCDPSLPSNRSNFPQDPQDPLKKDRINDPELIKQFAKKLFGFRSIDISKNLRDYNNGVNKGIVLNNLNHCLNDELAFRKAFNYNDKHYDNIVLQAKNLVNRIEDSYLHSDFEKVLLDLNIKNRIDKIIVSDLRHNVKDFIEETLNQREQFVTNYNLPEKDFRTELGDKVIQASFTATQNCAINNNKNLTEHLIKNSLNALKFIYGFANEFGDKFANDLFMHIASMPMSYATGALVAYFGTPALLIVGGVSIGFRITQIISGIPLSGEHFESFRQALGDENFILAGREYFKALQACGVVDITEDVISIFTGGGLINKGISKVTKITKLDNAAQAIIKNIKKISRLDKTVDIKVSKKFRKRARKLKQLEECFEPVVNPDGTISYYPPEGLNNNKLSHFLKNCSNESNKDFFQQLKFRSDKSARALSFGKLYRDSVTKLWWSKDKSNHGGSCYKVFKEKANGFEWQFDADVYGVEITNKHKGPVGLFISKKAIVFKS